MSFSRSRNKFLQFPKPSTPPKQGTTELFFDSANGGVPTVYYPDGTTQPLIGNKIDGVDTNYFKDTKQGNGFYRLGLFSCDLSTGELSLSTDNAWYYNGCKYTLTSPITITPTYSNGFNYVYLVGNVITVSDNPSNINGVMLCTIYKIGDYYICGDERHNTFFDPSKFLESWETYDKFNNNIKITNGLDISFPANFVSDPNNTNLNSGVYFCDDILISLFDPSISFMIFAQEYSDNGQKYVNRYNSSLQNYPVKLDSGSKVQYYTPGNPTGSWTTLTDNYYTSYIIFLTNNVQESGSNNTILFSYNEGIETANLTDLNNINIHIPLDCLRYMTPLYRIIVDKNANIIRIEDFRGMDIASYSKESYHSNCSSKVFCDYTKTNNDNSYDIINYIGATGNHTTSLAITADGSASTGLYVSGEVDNLGSMANITNNGAGTSLKLSNTGGGKALEVSGDSDINGKVFYGIETIRAGASITPVGDKRVIKVTSDGSTQNNTLTMPTGASGQIITIINLDEDPINGDVYIPSGEVQTYIYIDSDVGWIAIGPNITMNGETLVIGNSKQ